MKQLFTIDLKDYDGCNEVFSRPSARGVILTKDGKIALVYSQRDKYYKFPGGGIKESEDKVTALIREVSEEVGLKVIPDSIKEFGSVLRRQKSNRSVGIIFEQENFYYFCEVSGEVGKQHLDDYEAEAGFELRVVSLDEAIEVNKAFTCDDNFDQVMIEREKRVLELIKEAIVTDRLIIRPVTLEDAEEIHLYAGDPGIDMMMFLPNESFEETVGFTQYAVNEWRKAEPEDREFVITLDGKVIGGVNLEYCPETDAYEIGWTLNKDYRCKGYATEAARALMDYGFDKLNARCIQAHCDSRNIASEKVMKKLGMKLADDKGTRYYPKTGVTAGEYLYIKTR